MTEANPSQRSLVRSLQLGIGLTDYIHQEYTRKTAQRDEVLHECFRQWNLEDKELKKLSWRGDTIASDVSQTKC